MREMCVRSFCFFNIRKKNHIEEIFENAIQKTRANLELFIGYFKSFENDIYIYIRQFLLSVAYMKLYLSLSFGIFDKNFEREKERFQARVCREFGYFNLLLYFFTHCVLEVCFRFSAYLLLLFFALKNFALFLANSILS